MATTCSQCNSAIPNDGKTRKRARPRRCKVCNNQAALDRRRKDPIARFQHKLQNNLRKHYPNVPSSLCSRETVEYIYNKWDKKCVISGEASPINLCIVPAFRTKNLPTRDQFVLLSIHEAMTLARHDREKRLSKFSDEVKEKLQL